MVDLRERDRRNNFEENEVRKWRIWIIVQISSFIPFIQKFYFFQFWIQYFCFTKSKVKLIFNQDNSIILAMKDAWLLKDVRHFLKFFFICIIK